VISKKNLSTYEADDLKGI